MNWCSFAVYYFENASLTATMNEQGIILFIEYLSLTEFEKDLLSTTGKAETVYRWDAIYTDRAKPSEVCYHQNKDENTFEDSLAFIEEYLRMQGIDKDTPDGISYDSAGYPLVVYYVDEIKNQYSFVVHFWGEYWVDYEAGTTEWRDDVYCTTYYLDGRDKAGNLIYEDNTEQNNSYERVYDDQGQMMADLSYEYFSDIPIPFITGGWNYDSGYEIVNQALCRNQKFWIDKELALFDDNGKFTGIKQCLNASGWSGRNYFSYDSQCNYDMDGKLEIIREEVQEADFEDSWGQWDDNEDYSGQIKLEYYANGKLKAVDYNRSSYIHGTTDSGGIIEYDNKGRMICNSYYITHGSHSNVFLYRDDSTRPWVVFNWCSFAPGFENIYMYQPSDYN